MDFKSKSDEIRDKTLEYHKARGWCHVGSSMSAVEILTVLYYGVMEKGDEFILSKGHASSTLYIVLNDKGLLPEKDLFCLEEHPSLNKEFGISATTGSLGHGLSLGLGMAFADKEKKVYVLLGDGECDEGQVWEAARLTSELRINNLVAIVDCNGFQGFKKSSRRIGRKFEAFGWDVIECDGHECNILNKVLRSDHQNPLVILARTVKGRGVGRIENRLESHYEKLNEDDFKNKR